jgi:integrase
VSDVVIGRILRGEVEATVATDDAAHAHVLVAIFLLTGCRFREVAGLELDDVSFDPKTITVRPNRWRGLKTPTSHRVIPLWGFTRTWATSGTGPRPSSTASTGTLSGSAIGCNGWA